MKTELSFTDDELQLIAVALRTQARAAEGYDTKYGTTCYRGLAADATRLAQRFEGCLEPFDEVSHSRGDREDFHSDG
jgi:hypothetical protein